MTTLEHLEASAPDVPAEALIPTQVSPLELDPRSWYKATGRAIASGGELLRAPSASSVVSIPLPVQRLIAADTRLRLAAESSVTGTSELTEKAVLLALEHLGVSMDVRVSLRADVHPGLGLSATATEIVAVLRGVFAALSYPASPALLASLSARAGVPTGLAWPGLVAVDAEGSLAHSFPTYARFAVALITPQKPSPRRDLSQVSLPSSLLDEMLHAMRSGNEVEVAALSTRSALLTSEQAPHPLLSPVMGLEEYLTAEGVTPLGYAISHDGGALCLLYPSEYPTRSQATHAARVVAGLLEDVRTSATITPL